MIIHQSLIIFILMCSAQSNLVNYVTADLVKILEEKRYSEVFDRLCRIREKGDCFPDLEEAFAKGTEDNMWVSELSTHEGYTSAIYKYRNVFAVKYIAVSSENMLKYALSEVNTGIKVKESMDFFPIEGLVPTEQCCAVEASGRSGVLYYFFLRIPFFKYKDLRSVMNDMQHASTTESMVWALNVCISLADAVKILHEKNYAHRDIKPANILMRTLYNPQLTDFGFAKKILDSAKTVLGSDNYMAPEFFTREGYGTKVDIHNLGIVFFEIFHTHLIKIQARMRKIIRNSCDKVPPYYDAFGNRRSIYCEFFHPIIIQMVQNKPDDRPDIDRIIHHLKDAIEAYWKSLNSNAQDEFFASSNDFLLDTNNPLKVFLLNLKEKSELEKLPI